MGEFAAIAALAASAASTVTSLAAAGAAASSGRVQRELAQQQAALQVEQTQQQMAAIEDQRQQVTAAARQEETNRLVTLRRTLGAQAAIRGARGLNPDSVGGDVLEQASMDEAQRDLDTILVNAERERRSLGLSASRAALSGEVAVTQTRSSAFAADAQSKARQLEGYGSAFGSGVRFGNQGFKYLSAG